MFQQLTFFLKVYLDFEMFWMISLILGARDREFCRNVAYAHRFYSFLRGNISPKWDPVSFIPEFVSPGIKLTGSHLQGVDMRPCKFALEIYGFPGQTHRVSFQRSIVREEIAKTLCVGNIPAQTRSKGA